MEPAGLSVGIVGLAGLLSSCLEALDRVKAYQSFTSDTDVLNAQLEAERLLFERWGHGVGLDKGELSADHKTSLVVEELRRHINKILETNDSIHHIGKAKSGPLNNATLGMVNQPPTRVTEPSGQKDASWLGLCGGREIALATLASPLSELTIGPGQVSPLSPLNQVHEFSPG